MDVNGDVSCSKSDVCSPESDVSSSEGDISSVVCTKDETQRVMSVAQRGRQ
jgi:hypothetical protein